MPEAMGRVAGGGAGRGWGSGKRWGLLRRGWRGSAAASEGENGLGIRQSQRCSARGRPHMGKRGIRARREAWEGVWTGWWKVRGQCKEQVQLRVHCGAVDACGSINVGLCRARRGCRPTEGRNWVAGVRGAPVGEASWAPARGWPGAPSGRRGALYTSCSGVFVCPCSMEGVVSVLDTVQVPEVCLGRWEMLKYIREANPLNPWLPNQAAR